MVTKHDAWMRQQRFEARLGWAIVIVVSTLFSGMILAAIVLHK